MMLAALTLLIAEVQTEPRSPSFGAAIGGFALLALWLLIIVAFVVRQRRRRAVDPAQQDEQRPAS